MAPKCCILYRKCNFSVGICSYAEMAPKVLKLHRKCHFSVRLYAEMAPKCCILYRKCQLFCRIFAQNVTYLCINEVPRVDGSNCSNIEGFVQKMQLFCRSSCSVEVPVECTENATFLCVLLVCRDGSKSLKIAQKMSLFCRIFAPKMTDFCRLLKFPV